MILDQLDIYFIYAKQNPKEPQPQPHTLYKTNSKWIIDWNVKTKNFRKTSENLYAVGLGKEL